MKNRLLLLLAGTALAAGGYFAAVATAAGPPTNPNETLYYAGYVTDTSGNPANGTYTASLDVFKDMSATTQVCSTGTVASLEVTDGHFRIALPSACVDAFKAEPDTWLRLTFDGSVMGITKVGAVPYALEAGHAVTADTATNATNATNAVNADNATTASSVTWDNVTSKPALNIYTNPNTSTQRTLDGSPCGLSSAPMSGAIGGYAAAKSVCETQCGSSTAHMCGSDEMIRYVETGGSGMTQATWIAGGAAGEHQGAILTDCNGFLSNDPAYRGTYWNAGGYAGPVACDAVFPIACCD